MTGDNASLRPGTALGGYRIERLIGTGGAAAVYEARKMGPDGPGERVACKVMHLKRRVEPLHCELVRREAVLGLRITSGHPNLVEVLDFFDDAQEQLCIVMELVDGASLADLREPGQRMPFPMVRRIAGEVLEALVYLHGRGVLHRDLSARNILVSTGGAVKLADLGLARVMEQGKVHTGTFGGTPMYATPEAIQLLDLDERADLFTLASVLYELVAGAPPCGQRSLVASMLVHIVAGKFAPLPPDTPADLAELITGLLRVEREERRPQTAADALALLRDHGLPAASPAELGELAAAARTRRDQAIAGAPPPDALAPGTVLAPRMTSAPPGRADERAGERAAGAAPERVTGELGDAVPEPILDAIHELLLDAEAEAGRASGGTKPRRWRPPSRLVVRHVAGVVALVAFLMVLALLPGDRLRGEHDAAPQRPDVPAPALAPAPSPPAAPLVVEVPAAPVEVPAAPAQAEQPPEPRRLPERAARPPRERVHKPPHSRPTRPAPRRRRPVRLVSEEPRWGVE